MHLTKLSVIYYLLYYIINKTIYMTSFHSLVFVSKYSRKFVTDVLGITGVSHEITVIHPCMRHHV